MHIGIPREIKNHEYRVALTPEGARVLTDAQRRELEHTVLARHVLEEQYENLEQQQRTAAFGMWVFLATGEIAYVLDGRVLAKRDGEEPNVPTH